MKRMCNALLLLVLISGLIGCSTTQKGAGIGALGGAALGGIIGHQSGHGLEGAAIGAAAGAISGGVIGENMDKKFCPVCGEEYTSGVQYCPKDGTELKIKQ